MSSRLERLRERRRRRRIRARIITASLGAGALTAGVIAYAGPFGEAAGQATGRPAPVVTPQVLLGELTAAAAGSPVKAGTGTGPAPAGAAAKDPGGTETAKQENKDKKPAAGKTGRKSREKAAIKASGPSEYTDERAVAYFTTRWQDEATERITDIRTVGRYLRIYTDLPESADNSKTALKLCERGLEYLAELGETNPVVFVQAKYGGNGNPVLANVLGPEDDDCRVTHPKPR